MPVLIVEGPDEVGKTSLAHALVAHLHASGRPARYLAFPGHEPNTIGAEVYRLHHDSQRGALGDVPPLALQLLHLASHAQSVALQVQPLLRDGRILVLDRFWWSLAVYGRHYGISEPILRHLVAIERLIWSQIKPACVVLITRAEPLTSAISTDEFTRIAQIYRDIADDESQAAPVVTLDNSGPFERSVDELLAIAGAVLPSRTTI